MLFAPLRRRQSTWEDFLQVANNYRKRVNTKEMRITEKSSARPKRMYTKYLIFNLLSQVWGIMLDWEFFLCILVMIIIFKFIIIARLICLLAVNEDDFLKKNSILLISARMSSPYAILIFYCSLLSSNILGIISVSCFRCPLRSIVNIIDLFV